MVGVDTHEHVDAAAAMDAIGGTVATTTIAADSGGFSQLLEWAHSFRSITAIIQTTIGSTRAR